MTSITWLDFETELMAPGYRLPMPAIATTFHAQDGARLWTTAELPALLDRLLSDDTTAIGGHNIAAFDLPVIAEHLPWLRPRLWAKLEAGQIVDTLVCERIVQINRGARGELGLGAIAPKYGIGFTDKTDPAIQAIRMSFGQFIGAKEIPAAHAAYALDDATVLPTLFERQWNTGLISWNDQAMLCRQLFWQSLVGARGFRTDLDRVRKLNEMVTARVGELEAIARDCGFLRKQGKDGKTPRNMKAIHDAIAMAYAPTQSEELAEARAALLAAEAGGDASQIEHAERRLKNATAAFWAAVPHTDPSTRHPNGQVAADRLTLEDVPGDSLQAEHLRTLSEWSQLLSIRNKDIPLFMQGAVEPVHTSFGIADTTRATHRPNCYDGETEILTPSGWTRFDALTDGTPVAQWAEGEISFVQPSAVIRSEYSGEMLHIQTVDYIDLCVTPNHRCPTVNRKSGRFNVHPASAFPRDAHHLHAGCRRDGALALPEWFLTLACATQADGSYVKDGGIRWAFSKRRKIERLRKALTESATPFSESVDGDRVCFYVGKNTLCSLLLKQSLPGKQFAPWLLDLNAEGLRFVADEVLLWDGCRKSGRYFGKSKKSVDLVQAVWALTGFRTCANSSQIPSGTFWVVARQASGRSLTTNRTVDSVPWTGKVYCVTVPSSFVLVRRNGRVSVSGNSANMGKTAGVRECVAARPGYALAVSDFKMLELVGIAQLCVERLGLTTLASKINSGADIHAEIGADILGCSVAEIVARRAAGDHEASEARDAGKPANFGMNGGMTNALTFQLYARKSYGQQLSLDQCERIMASWRNRAVDQQAYLEAIKQTRNELGLYDCLLPRTEMIIPRGLARTAASNYPFQSLGMRVADRAGWLVAKAQYCPTPEADMSGSHLILFVHDDLTSEIPVDKLDEHARIQERLMCQASREVCPDVFSGVDTRILTHLSKCAKASKVDGRWALTQVQMPECLGK